MAQTPTAAGSGPLLPIELMTAAEQRTWVLAAFAASQAYKTFQFGETMFVQEHSDWLLLKWTCIDLVLIGFIIPRLRIPRLDWPIASRVILLLPLLAFNYLLFSPYAWLLIKSAPLALISSILPEYRIAVDEHRVRTGAVRDPHLHILGRHTIHVLPHATARLNPYSESFCLPANDPKAVAFIPLTFNNSRPHTLTYSHTDFATGDTKTYDVADAQLVTALANKHKQKEVDDADDEWLWPALAKQAQKHLFIEHPTTHPPPSHALKIKRPGLIKLVKVQSAPPLSADIPFSRTEEVRVVECPSVKFAKEVSAEMHRCIGDSEEVDLLLRGVAPFSLEYARSAPGKKSETLTIDGIAATAPVAVGQAVDITLPLNYTLDAAGQVTLQLLKVTDALSNSFSVPGQPERRISVHTAPRVSIADCSIPRPVKLLQDIRSTFRLNIDGVQKDEGPYVVSVRRPSGKVDEIKVVQHATARSVAAQMDVDAPGEYEVLEIGGKYCKGVVLAPSRCPVTLQPPPTVSFDFQPITDQCAGSIGLRIHAALSGEAPFKLHYQVTHEHGKHKRTTKHVKTIMQVRDEIVFQPDQVGHFTWEALSLEDAHYASARSAQLKKGEFKGSTEVHPLASASWRKRGEEDVKSCDGKSIWTEIELTGMPPWTVQYESQYGSTRQKHVMKNIKSSPAKVEVPIPGKLDKSGGTFALSLMHVEDKRGCKRTLQTRDLNIHVIRTKPTAKFYGGKDRLRKIRQGQDVTLPLRLTGEAPWKVKYRLQRNTNDKERTVSVSSPNGELLVDQDGTYTLIEVHDRYCQGSISATDQTFRVEYLSKPTLSIKLDSAINDTSTLFHRHKALQRRDVCLNVMDTLELALTGAPPFKISYDVIAPSGHRKSKTLLAVQHSATLVLSTDEPGRHAYEITGISDTLYENPADGILLSQGAQHHGNPIRVDQRVLPLPSGSFKAVKALPRFCVNDELGARKTDDAVGMTDLVLKLDGEPPFQLELEVKPVRSSVPPQRFTAHEVNSKEWPVKLPYGFSNAGRYEVTLWSVRDGNGCERIIDKATLAQTASFEDNLQVFKPPAALVDVADTANIIAAQPRRDHCVGDNLEFILQGTAPWTITYHWQGHKREVVSRKPTFSRLAEKPGTFTVSRIAHQQNQCSTAVDIVKEIHALPTVSVSSGKNTVQDITEGDEATIDFKFTGTPPFTFKYTRSLPTAPFEVLEEKTVANINTQDYSVVASTEGSFAVTYVQDKFCAVGA